MQYRPDDTPEVEHEMAYRVYARFLLADSRALEARKLLSTLEQRARSGERYGRLMTFRILQSQTEEALGNHHLAIEYMAEAVRMAAPEGYQRIFLDAGGEALALLPQVRSEAPEFVDILLRADPINLPSAHPKVGALPQVLASQPVINNGLDEPLSDREREVLVLLAQGLTYRQIAGTLIIALGTVRAHCSNIYGKMGVENRTQAILKAKDAGLISL
jgi:LuxR family maltose regulon positive regulatory protein